MGMGSPEGRGHPREVAESGEFEVVIEKDGEELGRLDRTFSNEYDAGQAAYAAEIPDVGIETTVERSSRENT